MPGAPPTAWSHLAIADELPVVFMGISGKISANRPVETYGFRPFLGFFPTLLDFFQDSVFFSG